MSQAPQTTVGPVPAVVGIREAGHDDSGDYRGHNEAFGDVEARVQGQEGFDLEAAHDVGGAAVFELGDVRQGP